MAELGHTSPSLALSVYAQAMRMSEDERSRLRALVEGAEWAAMDSSEDLTGANPWSVDDPRQQRTPRLAGLSRAAEGTRTLDLLHGKQTL